MSSKKKYYVYLDENKEPYYYDVDTQTSTYDVPKDALLLNPDNFKPFFDDQGNIIDYSKENASDADDDESSSSSSSQSHSNSSESEHNDKNSSQEKLDSKNDSEDSDHDDEQEEKEEAEERQVEEEEKEKEKEEKREKKKKRKSPKKSKKDKTKKAKEEHEEDDQKEVEDDSMPLDVPDEVQNFDEGKVKLQQEAARKRKPTSTPLIAPPNEGEPNYLPSDLQDEIKKFSNTHFFNSFFQQHRNKHKFSRKNISVDSLAEFSAEPITEPLIEVPEKDTKFVKLALQSFKYILYYTKVEQTKNPAIYLDRLVDLLYNNPQLRDETMFQLIKQTRKNENEDWRLQTWMLFVVIVTIFPSSRNSEDWIKSHFAQQSKSTDYIVSQYASFCYIRFSARCAIGKPMDSPNEIGYFQKIPTQMAMGFQSFGASIYEQIWNQRRTLLRLPIPFTLYLMASKLLSKNCQNIEGIFRLPGNLKLVDSTAEKLNKGINEMDSLGVHDIASLLKKWVRDLPDPLVNLASNAKLENAYDTKEYLEFTDKELPKTHRLTLMFLIGFLQELVKYKDVTLMNAYNYAVVFAPNIVQVRDTTEPNRQKKFSKIAIEYLTDLIEHWDTSYMFPLDKKFLQQ